MAIFSEWPYQTIIGCQIIGEHFASVWGLGIGLKPELLNSANNQIL